MTTLECEVCGKRVRRQRGNHRYCSRACQDVATAAQQQQARQAGAHLYGATVGGCDRDCPYWDHCRYIVADALRRSRSEDRAVAETGKAELNPVLCCVPVDEVPAMAARLEASEAYRDWLAAEQQE